jgi:hypothetical protein
LKGTDQIQYQLGCDYIKDNTGTLCFASGNCIEKMIEKYERMYGSKPSEYISLLEKTDHLEIEWSEELDQAMDKTYQSMIESLKWAISPVQFDIQTVTRTLSVFPTVQRKGNLERLNRMYGYL